MRLKSAPKDSFKYYIENTDDVSKKIVEDTKKLQKSKKDFDMNFDLVLGVLTSNDVGGLTEFISYFLYVAVVDQYLAKGGNDFVLSERLCEKLSLTYSQDIPYEDFKVSDAVNMVNLDHADLYVNRELKEQYATFGQDAGTYSIKIRGVLIVDTDKMNRKIFKDFQDFMISNVQKHNVDNREIDIPIQKNRYIFVVMLENAPEPYAQFISVGKSKNSLTNLKKTVSNMMLGSLNQYDDHEMISPIGIAFDLAVKAILYMNESSSNIENKTVDFGYIRQVVQKKKKGPPKYKGDYSVTYVQEKDVPKKEANWVASDDLVDQVDEIMDIVNSEQRDYASKSPHYRQDHFKKRWVLKSYIERNDLENMIIREETFELTRKDGRIEEVTKYLVPIRHEYKNIIGGNTERNTVYKTKRLK